MPSAVTLVIYLSAAEAADPSSAALLRAARELLGNQAQVHLRTSDAIADEALASSAPEADAVAEVDWLSPDHRQATVRCYVDQLHRVVRRDVSFDDDAVLSERERMLGFVVASMLPSYGEPPVPASAVEADRPSPAPPPSTSARPAIEDRPILAPVAEHFVGLAELVGLAATGVGGTGGSFGAALAGRWLLGRSLSLRAEGGVRRGDIPTASATSEVDFAGLGLGLDFPLGGSSRFSLGGRAGGLVLRHEVSHLSADDDFPDHKSRLLLGADALVEGAWHFSPNAGFVAGVGTEFAFGHTDVFVKGDKVADIPPLRGLLELGIQAKF
ncbi:MAG: hypothetical protein ABI627_12700 [Polyangiaceae bacterium]